MLAFEAQQYVPFPLSEVALTHEVLSGGNPSEMAEVLLCAVRRSLSDRYRATFSGAGLELKQLGINAFGLWALGASAFVEERAGITLLVDIGAATTDLAILAQEKPLFLRSLPFGGEALTGAIQSDLGETRDGAESLKQARGLALLQEADMPQTRRWLERLVGEIKRSLLAFATERGAAAEDACLCGGGASLDGLPRYLSDALDLPVTLLAAGNILTAGDPLAPRFATAAGMAMVALEKRFPAIDYVATPKSGAVKSRFPVPYRSWIVAVVLAGLVGTFLFSGFLQERMVISQQLQSVNRLVKTHASTVEKLRSRKEELQSQVEALEAGLRKQTPWLEVFKEINDRFPKGLWLEEVSMERSKPITLRGLATEDGAVSDLLVALGNSPRLSEVRLSYLTRTQEAGKIRYRFLVNCSFGQTPPVKRFVKTP